MTAVRSHAVVGLAYVALAAWLTWPLPLDLGSSLTGPPGGDTGVYVWNLWVFSHELEDGRLPFYTSTILNATSAVRPVNLSFHNYTTFANLIALPLLPWLGTVATFNVIYLLNIALAGYTMFLLARYLTQRDTESWLAGALFAACPALIAKGTAHFSLVAAAPLPLFVLFLSRTIRGQRVRDGVFAGLIVAWAAFCDPYYAVYCLLITGFMLIANTLQLRRPMGETAPRRLKLVSFLDVLLLVLGGLVIGMAIRGGGPVSVFGLRVSMRTLYTPVLVLSCMVLVRVALTVRPFVRIELSWPSRTWIKVVVAGVLATLLPLSPVLFAFGERLAYDSSQPRIFWRSSPPGVDLLSFFLPNPNHPLWGASIQQFIIRMHGVPDAFPEFVASIPFAVLALFAVASWWTKWRPTPVLLLFTLTFGTLALGPFVQIAGMNTYVPTPWALLRYVPLVGLARSPSRLAVVAMLGIAMLFAVALVHLTTRAPQRRRTTLVVTSLLLLFELSPAPRTLYSAEIPPIYRIIADDHSPDIRVLSLPLGVRDGASSLGNFRASAQFHQTAHRKGLIGGYVSRVSQRRKNRLLRVPMVDALMTLSEGRELSPEQRQRAKATAAHFLSHSRIRYVVADTLYTSPELFAFTLQALPLTKIADDGRRKLYMVPPLQDGNALFGDPPAFLDSISERRPKFQK